MVRISLVAMALMGAALAGAQATLYQTNFGNPFVPGPIQGQDSWLEQISTANTVPPSFTVMTSGPNTDEPVVSIDGSQCDAGWAWHYAAPLVTNNTSLLATASIYVPKNPSTSGYRVYGIDCYGFYNTLGARLAFAGIGADEKIRLFSGNFEVVSPNQRASADNWHRLQMLLNFKTMNVTAFVDGVDSGLIASFPNIQGNAPLFSDADLACLGSGSQPGYFRSYSLVQYTSSHRYILGHVRLDDYEGDQDQVPLTLDLVGSSGQTAVHTTIFSNGSGDYSYTTDLNGNYQVFLKAPHWLRSYVGTVNINNNAPVSIIPDVTLTNGDIDGNNIVNINDYAMLSDCFNAVAGDSRYVPSADLDGNGAVNINDYRILSDNFGKAGR